MEHLDQPLFLLDHGVENPTDGISSDEEYLYVVELPTQYPFDEPTEWTVKVSDSNGSPCRDDRETKPLNEPRGSSTGRWTTQSENSLPNLDSQVKSRNIFIRFSTKLYINDYEGRICYH